MPHLSFLLHQLLADLEGHPFMCSPAEGQDHCIYHPHERKVSGVTGESCWIARSLGSYPMTFHILLDLLGSQRRGVLTDRQINRCEVASVLLLLEDFSPPVSHLKGIH